MYIGHGFLGEVFFVDLAYNGVITKIKDLCVEQYTDEVLQQELDEFGVKNPQDLQDYDRMIFKSKLEAEMFINMYKLEYERIVTDKTLCQSRFYPALAYRRRYLPLALMGLKLQTTRDFLKPWPVDQLFNLHDRTYFLTVRLKEIKKTGPKQYTYFFYPAL